MYAVYTFRKSIDVGDEPHSNDLLRKQTRPLEELMERFSAMYLSGTEAESDSHPGEPGSTALHYFVVADDERGSYVRHNVALAPGLCTTQVVFQLFSPNHPLLEALEDMYGEAPQTRELESRAASELPRTESFPSRVRARLYRED